LLVHLKEILSYLHVMSIVVSVDEVDHAISADSHN
jgi:hypothetical protein